MNKLYMSEKQANCMGVRDVNYVMVDGEYKEYTEWCTGDEVCNWDDAVLVLATEKEPKIKMGENKNPISYTDEILRLFIR